jgi:16S rRNA processing protein RimM
MPSEFHRHIGKLAKLHGTGGEVLILSDSIFPKKIEKTEWVFLLIDGLPVPFFVSSFALRSESSAILKFADINSAEEMQELVGYDVLIAEKRKHKSRTFSFMEDIAGYKVLDSKHESIGIVKSILNYQDNFLLQVFQGNREILIPFNENTVNKIDNLSNTIIINVPDGLLELYD